MKAVVQHTMIGLFCLACVVMATPPQHFPHRHMPITSIQVAADRPIQHAEAIAQRPDLDEGAARLACW